MAKKRKKVTVKSILEFVNELIDARYEWAQSPDGRARLGPGMPTIPGLEEWFRVRDYIETGSKDPFIRR